MRPPGSTREAETVHDPAGRGSIDPNMSRPDPFSSRYWVPALVAIAVFAGGVRLWVAAEVTPVRLVGDEMYYEETAKSIGRGAGHYSTNFKAWAAWPPGNSWWLSHFVQDTYSTVPVAPRAAVLGQIVLGILICLLSAVHARLLFDARTGLLTACIVSVYPTLVAFSHYLWAASLFTVLILMGLVGVLLADRHPRDMVIIGVSGLIFGLATLTRESALAIAGGAALWWLWCATPGSRIRALARGAMLVAPALIVVAPWTVRNYGQLEQFVPVSTAGWLALAQGNSLGDPDWLEPDRTAQMAFSRKYLLTPERDRAAFGREQVARLVGDAQPEWLFKKLALNLSLLFRPDSFIFWKMSLRSYSQIEPWLSRSILVGTIATYLVVMALAIFGSAVSIGRRASFLVCVCTPIVALHVVAFASSRYRLPLMPLFIAYAAHACVGGSGLSQLRKGRRAAVTAVGLTLLALFTAHFLDDAIRIWKTGSYFS